LQFIHAGAELGDGIGNQQRWIGIMLSQASEPGM
jgi:hypothetical protein